MAVLQFKFDESYDDQVMAVGGWVADELEWKRLESRWQRRVTFENVHARSDQQITRYHAAEMNCKDNEYEHWDSERCRRFSKHLIHLLSKRRMGAISVACDLDAIKQVFPNGDKAQVKSGAYTLCFKLLMTYIAEAMVIFFPGDTVLLIHDHGNWDGNAMEAYNVLVDDVKWERRTLFEGLLPKTGTQCVGLQAADMFAYETFKGGKAHRRGDTSMRPAIREMTNKQIPIRSHWLDIDGVRALYREMKNSGKYPELDQQGIG